MMKRATLLIPAVIAIALIAGCGADDGAATTASASASGTPSEDCNVVDGTTAARDAEVHVDLDEYSIKVDATSVSAGNVEFHTTNDGDEPHELVIVRGARPADLTITHGGLDEKALPPGAEVLGEIEPFTGKGEVCSGVFALTAGDYTLLCNVVEPSGAKHAHAMEGMVTAFTVK
jgi:hypothetical protein